MLGTKKDQPKVAQMVERWAEKKGYLMVDWWVAWKAVMLALMRVALMADSKVEQKVEHLVAR